MWLRLAGRSERPRVRDGWSCSYSGAGYPKTFVRRTSAVYCRARRLGGVAQATNRGVVVREPGCSGRLASRNGKCRVKELARVGESPGSGGCVRRQDGGRDRVWLQRAGRDLPAVGGELAGDRDRDDRAGFVARVFELAPAGVEAALRFPGDVDDLGRLAASSIAWGRGWAIL